MNVTEKLLELDRRYERDRKELQDEKAVWDDLLTVMPEPLLKQCYFLFMGMRHGDCYDGTLVLNCPTPSFALELATALNTSEPVVMFGSGLETRARLDEGRYWVKPRTTDTRVFITQLSDGSPYLTWFYKTCSSKVIQIRMELLPDAIAQTGYRKETRAWAPDHVPERLRAVLETVWVPGSMPIKAHIAPKSVETYPSSATIELLEADTPRKAVVQAYQLLTSYDAFAP